VRIDQIVSMNEGDQSFTIDMTYTQSWHDPRLKFPPPNGEVPYSPLSLEFLKTLWIPSVYLTNSLKPNLVQLTPRFLDIDTNNSLVILTAKQVVKLKCLMNLFRFPMDSQTCPIEFTLLITRKHRVALHLEDFSLGELNISEHFKRNLDDLIHEFRSQRRVSQLFLGRNPNRIQLHFNERTRLFLCFDQSQTVS
jgi:hypothetical protein